MRVANALPDNAPAVRTANAAAARPASAVDLGLDVSALFCYLVVKHGLTHALAVGRATARHNLSSSYGTSI